MDVFPVQTPNYNYASYKLLDMSLSPNGLAIIVWLHLKALLLLIYHITRDWFYFVCNFLNLNKGFGSLCVSSKLNRFRTSISSKTFSLILCLEDIFFNLMFIIHKSNKRKRNSPMLIFQTWTLRTSSFCWNFFNKF